MAPSQMSALTAKVMRSLRQSKRAFDMAANQGKRSLSSSSSSSSSSYSMVQQQQQQQREEQQPDTNARCPFLAVHGLQEGASHGCPYLLSMKAKEKEEESTDTAVFSESSISTFLKIVK